MGDAGIVHTQQHNNRTRPSTVCSPRRASSLPMPNTHHHQPPSPLTHTRQSADMPDDRTRGRRRLAHFTRPTPHLAERGREKQAKRRREKVGHTMGILNLLPLHHAKSHVWRSASVVAPGRLVAATDRHGVRRQVGGRVEHTTTTTTHLWPEPIDRGSVVFAAQRLACIRRRATKTTKTTNTCYY